MLEALGRAWRAGHAQVALTVHPGNPAVRLYERCGFRPAGDRRGYHLMVASAARAAGAGGGSTGSRFAFGA